MAFEGIRVVEIIELISRHQFFEGVLIFWYRLFVGEMAQGMGKAR